MSQPYTQEDYQTQEDRQYYDEQLESAEEHESKPSEGDEPSINPLFSETLSQFSRLHRSPKIDL